jgi:hypothetical protein
MRHITTDTENLYVRSMGKLLRVVAMFDNDDDANKYMENHDETAVVACFGSFVLLANKYDKGACRNCGQGFEAHNKWGGKLPCEHWEPRFKQA